MQNELQVHAPLYVLTATMACWKCRMEQTVVALGCHNLSDGDQDMVPVGDVSELLLLSDVTKLPPLVLQELVKRNPLYALRYSSTAEEEYFANTCGCGALFGDLYLYSEPGGAFFPKEPTAARAILLEQLAFERPMPFECSFSRGGAGQLILEHAIRVEHGHG